MDGTIRFGVEFEMTVRPKPSAARLLEAYFGFLPERPQSMGYYPWRKDNGLAVIRLLRWTFSQLELPVNDTVPGDYTKWSIVSDPSSMDGEEFYGVEVISPILESENGSQIQDSIGDWQLDVEAA